MQEVLSSQDETTLKSWLNLLRTILSNEDVAVMALDEDYFSSLEELYEGARYSEACIERHLVGDRVKLN